MLRRLVVLAASLVGAALVIPAIASAGGSPEEGAVFYADQPVVIEFRADSGTSVDVSGCSVGVTGPDGYSAEASSSSNPGVRCYVSLALPTPLPAGSYSWRARYGWAATVFEEPAQSFTIIERPPPPPPPPPPPAPEPAPPTPAPAPTPTPALLLLLLLLLLLSRSRSHRLPPAPLRLRPRPRSGRSRARAPSVAWREFVLQPRSAGSTAASS